MLKQMGLEAEVDMDNVVSIDKVNPLFDVENFLNYDLKINY